MTASSPPNRPIKRVSHPTTLGLDIVPRTASSARSPKPASNPLYRRAADDRLTHTDAFRLTVRAYDETYHLHLRPNDAILHPQARINHYSPSGEIIRTEPLQRSDYLIFEGEVVAPERTAKRWLEDTVGGIISPSRRELGWARIIVHDQGDVKVGRAPIYEGAFTVNGVVHHIKTRIAYLQHRRPDLDADVNDAEEPLVVFRDSDMGESHSGASSCAHDSLPYNTDKDLNPVLSYAIETRNKISTPWYDPRRFDDVVDPLDLDARFVKRQGNDMTGNVTSNFVNRIGSHQGCKPTQSFVYMGVAADCVYVNKYGGTANATTQILNNWNSASALYKNTFNISMGIVQLEVQDPTCPPTASPSRPWNVACTDAITLNDRLSMFSAWRGAKGAGDGAGLWHLMSGCPTGSEVGVAWLGQLCNTEASGETGNVVSGTGVSTSTITEWQVVAHEIGHNFGAIHDCSTPCTLKDSCCPSTSTSCNSNAVYIMDAVSNVGENTFSQCSIGNICAAMETMNTTCLLSADEQVQVISKQMCGNGIVENGEDCDPGKGNDSPCCDSTTCKFVNGAVCDPKSSSCCLDTCRFAPATQVCRPSQDPKCDIAENCPGNSAECPTDTTVSDGTSCGGNNLACASGICTSPDLQCQTVGSSLGLTKACPSNVDTKCQVSCQDPSNSQKCMILAASLVDGSPCGYGGKCRNSACVAGSVGETIKAWYTQNLQISIPVTIAAGIVVLLILYKITTCIAGCCKRSSAKRQAARKASMTGRQRLASWAPNAGIPQDPAAAAAAAAYPQPRTSPENHRPSRSGYVSPGMSYPPSHANDDWRQSGYNNFENYQLDQRGGRALSPERRGTQDSRGTWVDDRLYNGNGYNGQQGGRR